MSFNADTALAEASVGYLKRLGPLTAKAFVGAAAIEHDIEPVDPEKPVQSQELGPKLVAELWLNMGASAWSSADLSWTSAHQTSAARLRTAYRVYGDVSLGLEAGLNANRQGEDARAGLFGRYAWDGGKLSLAEICAVAPGSLRDRQLADPILRPSRRQCDTRRENPTLLSPRVRVP
ncbi:MAG TPA: cellulose biosynthesis protein BcsS [Hyphomicrobium sp.]|jgi:hypothetical protein